MVGSITCCFGRFPFIFYRTVIYAIIFAFKRIFLKLYHDYCSSVLAAFRIIVGIFRTLKYEYLFSI